MTTTTTLADVAATSLSAVRTLERHGLDYCCGGKQSFDEACDAKGLKPESVMQEIERAQGPGASERDWQTAPLDEIVKQSSPRTTSTSSSNCQPSATASTKCSQSMVPKISRRSADWRTCSALCAPRWKCTCTRKN